MCGGHPAAALFASTAPPNMRHPERRRSRSRRIFARSLLLRSHSVRRSSPGALRNLSRIRSKISLVDALRLRRITPGGNFQQRNSIVNFQLSIENLRFSMCPDRITGGLGSFSSQGTGFCCSFFSSFMQIPPQPVCAARKKTYPIWL